MGLKDLLKDPSLYKVGEEGLRIPTINFTSKGLDYPSDKESPLLGRRVSFDITNTQAEPTFEIGSNIPHAPIDDYIRGGLTYAEEARKTDFDRIKAFFETPAGNLFITKQIALQSQNPRPQKIYNAGINTLASVASAGLTNVRRGGLLPEIGGIDLGKFIPQIGNKSTYVGEIGGPSGNVLRELNYNLGDPSKPTEKEGLAKLIDFNNPFKNSSLEYNVYVNGKIDKVNASPVLKVTKLTSNISNQDILLKDFVPFRFEINNPDKPSRIGNTMIAFRAFLDNISDDYNASLNTYKYNGRGEEFFTYNKFSRKMSVSFKIAAQSRHEMKPLYQKLNYLAAQTAPNYSSQGRIRTPYCYFTLGDWFQRIPGLITQVGLKWQKDYPWEIALDRFSKEEENADKEKSSVIEGKDKKMLILPHVLDVNLSFQPIHNFTPTNSYTTPFIGLEGDGVHTSWRLNSEGDLGILDHQLSDDPDDAEATSRFGKSEQESYYDE